MNRAYFAARIACGLLLLLLAGCFRPAGESIEPTAGVALPLATTDTQLSPDGLTTEEAVSDGATLSVTLPAITVIAPQTQATADTAVTLAQSTAQSSSSGDATGIPTLVAASSTPRFITPGSPLGPVTPDTATPTLNAPPTSTPSGLITPTALPGTEDECTYMVQSGDNLYRIATERGLTVEAMMQANPELVGDPPLLQPGQLLNLPDCNSEDGGAAQLDPQTPASADTTVSAAPVVPAGGELYVVQSGDTLFIIAQRYGLTVQELIDANNLPNPDRLDIGQELIIPPSS